MATAGADGLIWLWNINGEKLFQLDNSEPVFSVTTSPTSPLLFAGLKDKIKIWSLDTQEELGELEQLGYINVITINSSGTKMATGSTEQTVALWDIDSDGEVTQYKDLMQLNGEPRALAFSPDGHWLAGGRSSGFAYLWDVDAAQEMARIPHGANSVTSVTFSLDGTQLLTVSRKVVRIWDISAIPLTPKDKLISTACSHLVENLGWADWFTYFADESYQPICTNFP